MTAGRMDEVVLVLDDEVPAGRISPLSPGMWVGSSAAGARALELDRPLEGGRYFQEATRVPLLPQQGLDYWVEWVTATFKLARDE
jgi:hypothetical protein